MWSQNSSIWRVSWCNSDWLNALSKDWYQSLHRFCKLMRVGLVVSCLCVWGVCVQTHQISSTYTMYIFLFCCTTFEITSFGSGLLIQAIIVCFCGFCVCRSKPLHIWGKQSDFLNYDSYPFLLKSSFNAPLLLQFFLHFWESWNSPSFM
jgi:hypothetical protein